MSDVREIYPETWDEPMEAADFQHELDYTKRALAEARRVRDALPAPPEEGQQRSAEHEKHLFLSAQVTVVSDITKVLVKHKAMQDLRAVEGHPASPSFLQTAASFLQKMRTALERAAGLEASNFEHMVDAIRALLGDPVNQVGMAVGAAAGAYVAGSAAAPAVHAFATAGGAVLGGFAPFAALKCGAIWKIGLLGFGHLGTALLGGVVGAVVLWLIVKALRWVVEQWSRRARARQAEEERRREVEEQETERRSDMRRIMAELERAKENPDLTEESLTGAMDIFDACFVQVMNPAARGLECPVCSSGFPAGGSTETEKPCKAPNCPVDFHLCHKACLTHWQRTSGDLRCLICRQ